MKTHITTIAAALAWLIILGFMQQRDQTAHTPTRMTQRQCLYIEPNGTQHQWPCRNIDEHTAEVRL